MSIALYMDEHIQYAVTNGLRMRGVDVLTAQEDGMGEADDADLLDRAMQLGRVFFSQDEDLLIEASKRLATGAQFAGLIFLRQNRLKPRQTIEDLELICKVNEPAEFQNWIEYLPLK